MKVKIRNFDHLGNGIGKLDDKVVFVKRALPEEVVSLKIESSKKNYSFASIVDITKKSNDRVESICPYYQECGGCDFLHANKEIERDFKINKAKDLIGVNPKFFETCDYNYRNKVVLHGSGNKLGFYKEKSNDIIDIDYCYLLNDEINKVIKELKQFIKEEKALIEEVMIRFGDGLLVDIKGNLNDKIIDKLMFVDTIIINGEIKKGEGFITKKLLDYQFRISSKSFFQVNYLGLEKIYDILKLNLKEKYHLGLDLYSGTSVLGILLSSFCEKVLSIESNSSATSDALSNIKNNQISNIEVINDKVENVIDKLKDVDLIIVDPPRSGLDKETISYIKKINPKTLIYISCNMITLKRDLDELKDKFDFVDISLVDMFPRTYHVECVSVLHRKTLEK